MDPGATSKRHSHPKAEQVWVVEEGSGTLLLAEERTEQIEAGDVVRTPAGDIHGLTNSGSKPLVYIAITTPPQNFSPSYLAARPVRAGVSMSCSR
jgi:mannose-6-phosphate isomerase-like protein (cupin superfamily)